MVAIGGGRRVLLIGEEGVVLYAPSGKGIERELSLSWEVPNFDEQLVATLRSQNQGKSLLMIFDGADQTYRKEENIPKLSPIDRPRFVKRKLEYAFPSYPIRASYEIKPPSKKSGFLMPSQAEQQRSYLFVALPELEQLDRIGKIIYEAGTPVAGFGLLPLESTGLVAELSDKLFTDQAKKSRWAMIIGQHETGGLRQVVIKDGNLALTRLTPTSDSGTSGAGWVEEVTREFKATLTYISRFGYTEADGLDVVIIAGDIEKAFFDSRSMPVTNFQCLNVNEALQVIGAKSAGIEKGNFADPLHAAWTGKKGGLKLSVKVPGISRIQGPRLAARAGSVVLVLGVLGLLGLSGSDVKEYASLQSEISDKENQKTMLDREYKEESKLFDGLEMSPDALKSALNVKKVMDDNTVNVRHLLHMLKGALPSDVHVESLSMKHTPNDALSQHGLAPVLPGAFNLAGAKPPSEKGTMQVNFKFSLPSRLTLEQKVTRTEELQRSLGDVFKGYDVQVIRQFEDVSRQGNFSGPSGSDGAPEDPNQPKVEESYAEIQVSGAPL